VFLKGLFAAQIRALKQLQPQLNIPQPRGIISGGNVNCKILEASVSARKQMRCMLHRMKTMKEYVKYGNFSLKVSVFLCCRAINLYFCSVFILT
jgi:hypothetical protein